MKKLFLVAAVAASMALASCSGGAQCWEIGPKVLGVFAPTEYFYGTADEAEAYIKDTYGTSLMISKKKVKKSEGDCKGSIN